MIKTYSKISGLPLHLPEEVHKEAILMAHGGHDISQLLLNDTPDGLVEPLAVLRVGEAVRDHSKALMLPERQQDVRFSHHLTQGVDHALPDTRQITQVEDVVELGRRRQHFYLRIDFQRNLKCKFKSSIKI